MRSRVPSTILGLVGEVLGGMAGYFLFFWIYRQGFYAMIVPGGSLGMGSGLLAQHRSTARGVVCGLATVGLGLFTEWKFFPFLADNSFSYLLAHFHELKPVTLIMIGVGALIALWMGKDAALGGTEKPSRPGPAASDGE